MENISKRVECDSNKGNYNHEHSSTANTGDTLCNNLDAHEEDESIMNMDEMVVVDELGDEEEENSPYSCKAGTSSATQDTRNTAASSISNDSDMDDISDKGLEDEMLGDPLSDENDSEMDEVPNDGLERGNKSTWFQCEFCKQSFSRIRHRDNHYLQNHLNEENVALYVKTRIYTCKFCDRYKTVFARELRKHLAWKHKNEDIVSKCPDCGFSTMRLASFKKHMRAHEDSKKNMKFKESVRCKHCKTVCRGQKILRNHMLFKHPKQATSSIPSSQTYTCNICSTFKTTYKGQLQTHIWETHQGHTSAPNLQKKERNPVDKNHKCGACGLHFNTRIVLEKHIITKHYEYRDLVATVTCKYLQCSLCKFCAISAFDMERHNFRFHRELVPPHPSHDLTCKFCFNNFESKDHLHKHLLRRHFKEDLSEEIGYHRNLIPPDPSQPLNCSFCRAKLLGLDRLRKHLYKAHPKEDIVKAIVSITNQHTAKKFN